MKQILLLLLPCFALAQYQGNANQKITLGEQTTADGLVFRGREIDTSLITPRSDTSAYIILDTVNNKFYNYNRTTNIWSLAGGGTAVTSVATGLGLSGGTITSTGTILVDTASASIISRQRATNTFLTPTGSAATLTTGRTVQTNLASTSAATFNGSANISPGVTGVLPVANGGTGSASPNFVDLTTAQTVAGAKTFTSALTGTTAVFSSSVTAQGSLTGTGNYFVKNGVQNFQVNNATYWQVGSLPLSGTNIDNFHISNSNFGLPILYAQMGSPRNVGIRTTTLQSGFELTIADNVYVGGNVSASAYTTRSDYELKDEIQNISYGINEVMQMQPVKYTYKSNGSTQLGFIAQDLGVIIPEVVSFEDKMSVYYNALIPILTKAIQEQNAIIKSLEQRILTLENK